jgi:hypothetical protein
VKITDDHLKFLLFADGVPDAPLNSVARFLAEDLHEARLQLALVKKFCCIHQKDAGCIGIGCPGWAAGRAVRGEPDTKILKLMEERLAAAELVCKRAAAVRKEVNDRTLDEALDDWDAVVNPKDED